MAKNYKVAVIEPFGYRLSDTIDEPRTIDNIHSVEDIKFPKGFPALYFLG